MTEKENPEWVNCHGCDKLLHIAYIDVDYEGDPSTLIVQEGLEVYYCDDCLTRRVPGSVYDRKGLDVEQLKLDDEIV
jgi:hypothetical protein